MLLLGVLVGCDDELPQPPPERVSQVILADPPALGSLPWTPVEDLGAIKGRWRSRDGALLARVRAVPPGEESGAIGYWELDLELLGGVSTTCLLYEGLQGDPPWRLAACREEGAPEAVMSTVRLWSLPGRSRGRLEVEGRFLTEIERLE